MPSFRAHCGGLACLLTLSLRKRHICVFRDYYSLPIFFWKFPVHRRIQACFSCYFQKIRLISFNFALTFKQNKLTFCRLNDQVSCRAAKQPSQIAYIFPKILKCGLSVNKTKISSSNIVIMDNFTLVGQNKSKYYRKSFFAAFNRVRTCVLTLMTHVLVFLNYFSLSYFLDTFCYLQKVGLNSLKSALNFK